MKRSELPDNVFGIPEERKYPMPDKRHTLSAIKLFGHVEPKYEEELARNIIKNMKKYNIPESVVGKDNKLRKYIDKKSTNESYLLEESSDDTLEKIKDFNKELSQYKYNIIGKDRNTTKNINEYLTLSPSQFKKYKSGICWDYVAYEYQYFKSYFPNAKIKSFFFAIVKNNSITDTHTFLLFYTNNKVYWFEASWKSHCGIYEFNNEDEALSKITGTLRGSSKEDWFIVEYNAGDKKFINISDKEYISIMAKLPEYRYKEIKDPKSKCVQKIKIDKNRKINEGYITNDFNKKIPEYILQAAGAKCINFMKWCRMDDDKFAYIHPVQPDKVWVNEKDNTFTFAVYDGDIEWLPDIIETFNRNNLFEYGKFRVYVKDAHDEIYFTAQQNKKFLCGEVIEYNGSSSINNIEESYIEEKYIMNEISSNINSDYHSKGKKSLSSFKKEKISREALNKYKKDFKALSHIRENCLGYIYLDKNIPIAVIAVEEKTDYNFLQAVEIAKEYQGYGLSKQLLNVAEKELKATRLSVNKKNKLAIDIYKKYGFKEYDNSDTMIFMSINESSLSEFYSDNYIEEKYIMNDNDIYYNKDKFDNGEINLCFITGLSGSGKSTMAHKLEGDNIEAYELDDMCHAWKFNDSNILKSYGNIAKSFFSTVGKKYMCDNKEDWNKHYPNIEDKMKYTNSVIKDFIDYSIIYAKTHKSSKYVIEGVQIIFSYDPQDLKDYAVCIKGTSLLTSFIRAAKRDSQKGDNKIENSIDFLKRITNGKKLNFQKKNYKKVKLWIDYYKPISKIIESSLSEFSVGAGPVVGITSSPEPIYIVNYLQNNVFSGAQQERFGICKAGMKDLHIYGGKYNRLKSSNLEEFEKEASNIRVYKYTGKPLSSINSIVEDSSTDLDFYRLLTGEDIDKRSDIDFNPNFVRESYIKDELSAITECVNAGVKEIDNKYEIPMIGLNEDGRVYNYYRDLDGVYIKNEVTNMRSGSYIMAEDIPEEVSKLVKKGVY